jgi:hypothetical protein
MASAPTRERTPRTEPRPAEAPAARPVEPLPVCDLPEPPPLRKLIGAFAYARRTSSSSSRSS